MPITPAHGSDASAPDEGGGMSDTALFNLLAKGMLVGLPSLYVSAAAIAVVAGAGVGNALAIAAVPALFGGATFGGFVGLMRYLAQEERADNAARAARAVPATTTGRATTPEPPASS